MAKIWQDIEVTWEGETYTVRPTMAFVNMLEQGDGMSLSKLLSRIFNHDIPVGLAAEIIARTLRHAGKIVSAEEVYLQSGGISTELIQVASTILAGCMPVEAKADDKKKSPAKSAKLTGANSTE